jgi:hypothetical protein
VLIAIPVHLQALELRLRAKGFDLDAACAQDQYIPLDAEETLSKFMVHGWPDEDLFNQVISSLLTRARKGGRQVRAFGEMVAIMWGQGLNGATVHLEHLWHDLCHAETFPLF